MKYFFKYLLLLLFFIEIFGEDRAIVSSNHFIPRIGYIQIDKEHPIDSSTLLKIKLSIDHFKAEKVTHILLDLDTPGGEVFAAVKIAQILKKVQKEDGIPVVGYIRHWAISAGAMIAYACETLVTAPGASMGAAEPVIASEGKEMESAPEKINSALRAEFSNLASLWGRNPWLAEAMVDKDIILVERKNQLLKLDDPSQMKLTGNDRDQIISHRGKLLTLNSDQLLKYHIAQTKADSIWDIPLFENQKHIIQFDHWKLHFYSLLSHPFVISLLSLGFLVGLYMEVQSPGLIAPLILSLSCMGLLFLSRFTLETVHLLEWICLGSGLLLLAIELFVTPTFGIGGVVSIVMIIATLISIMAPQFKTMSFYPQWNLAAYEWIRQIAYLCLWIMIVSLVFAYLFYRSMQKVAHKGSLSTPALLHDIQQGEEGIAISDLRPMGKIDIKGIIYEVSADQQYIKAGTKVRVIRQEDNKLWVKNSS